MPSLEFDGAEGFAGKGVGAGSGAGLFVWTTCGVDAGAGVDSGFVVLQPTTNANDNPAAAAATTLGFNENIFDL
jgi:hypothetical protein